MLRRCSPRCRWMLLLGGVGILVAATLPAVAAEPAAKVEAGPAAEKVLPAAPQAAAPAAPSEANETLAVTGAKRPPENLWQMIVAGGPMNLAFMAFLGLISLVAAAVAMERLANLTRGKIVPPTQVRALEELAGSNEQRLDKFQAVCQQQNSPLASILRGGLLRVGRPLPEIEKALEDGAAREMAELRARVRPLSVAANVAPLVGLLGTVLGMLEAFRVASQAGLGKAELLAEGIYLALETTVAGLLIAIPALLFASYFHSRSERFLREISDCLTDLLPALASLDPRTASSTSTSRPLSNNPLMTSR